MTKDKKEDKYATNQLKTLLVMHQKQGYQEALDNAKREEDIAELEKRINDWTKIAEEKLEKSL